MPARATVLGVSSTPWHLLERTVSPEARQLYLRLHGVAVFVRDMSRSVPFYVQQLGFKLLWNPGPQAGAHWCAVAPPDGTAVLLLVEPPRDSEEAAQIGRCRNISLLTEDVPGKFREWAGLGVSFPVEPKVQPWGGMMARLEDPDGNAFTLVSHDGASREIEVLRRAKQEMEFAREVQARMFPRNVPAMRTLACAGACLQAHQVGGDYYDFIDLGRSRLAVVVGDVAGKGIAAALLMAGLHATLRSQRMRARAGLQNLLRSVNRFFLENSSESSFATLFFGEYDDETRALRYASCGHVPALLVRSGGAIERLESTSTVLGVFDDWQVATARRQFFPGDLLAVFTDGLLESPGRNGQEFGEARIIESLLRHRGAPAAAIVRSILQDVHEFGFSGRPDEQDQPDQQDDITLSVACCMA